MDMDNIIFTISGNTILSAVAVIGAIIALIVYFKKGVNWFDGVAAMKSDVEKYKNETMQNLENLEKKHDDDIEAIKEEQTLIIYGLLACLKGLEKQGCDGPVNEAIDKIEKHLNQQAHKK